MDNVVNIVPVIEKIKTKKTEFKLDITASIIALDQCLKTIKLNNLPELVHIKKDISKKIVELKKMCKSDHE
jgi:hypothetical protein